ncbi:hypothetical protein BGW80DRAFT_394453 [Lactifluus volemus]|nr:hypothetical protein BGW80DRAFT_394453 [Lactifluus volemus]
MRLTLLHTPRTGPPSFLSLYTNSYLSTIGLVYSQSDEKVLRRISISGPAASHQTRYRWDSTYYDINRLLFNARATCVLLRTSGMQEGSLVAAARRKLSHQVECHTPSRRMKRKRSISRIRGLEVNPAISQVRNTDSNEGIKLTRHHPHHRSLQTSHPCFDTQLWQLNPC